MAWRAVVESGVNSGERCERGCWREGGAGCDRPGMSRCGARWRRGGLACGGWGGVYWRAPCDGVAGSVGRCSIRVKGERIVSRSGERADATGGREGDPRVTGLRSAVARLRRQLAAHPADFPDRGIAEDELAALDALAVSGDLEGPRLRRSLLLIVGAIGSVSALGRGLGEVRDAVDLFEPLPRA